MRSLESGVEEPSEIFLHKCYPIQPALDFRRTVLHTPSHETNKKGTLTMLCFQTLASNSVDITVMCNRVANTRSRSMHCVRRTYIAYPECSMFARVLFANLEQLTLLSPAPIEPKPPYGRVEAHLSLTRDTTLLLSRFDSVSVLDTLLEQLFTQTGHSDDFRSSRGCSSEDGKLLSVPPKRFHGHLSHYNSSTVAARS